MTPPRTTSDTGIRLVQSFEGLRLTAYRDAVGVLTIGYGHTAGVVAGATITADQATRFLKADLASAETAVARLVKVPLAQHEFDALVSFTFNVGAGALEHSTLLRLLNAGERAAAAEQFRRWVHGAGSTVLPGLVTRREHERQLFLSPLPRA